MTKKQWKEKYKELEEEHNQLLIDYTNKKDLCDKYSSKCVFLTIENKNNKEQLTQAILDSSVTIEQIEDQEQEKRLELISKYSSSKQVYRLDIEDKDERYEKLRKTYTSLYDKHEHLELIYTELLNQHKEK